MNDVEPSNSPAAAQPGDPTAASLSGAASCACSGSHLKVGAAPPDAINLNVEGRGVHLTRAEVTPARIIATWNAQVSVATIAETHIECADPRCQWSKAGNSWQNSAIRTGIHQTTTPFRRIVRSVSKRWNDGPDAASRSNA